MVKQKKAKVIQMLSPVNYIRQKARTLPIYECLINDDWDETSLAHIIVARKHTTGNITFGLYLVDLMCLGVKDTSYLFNVLPGEYQEVLKTFEGRMEMMKVDYALVHNIIFAAIEFAEDFGFKPHKEFTSVAQYILEEDTDDIELMEIECGDEGTPVYFRGPEDSDARVKQILAQLERTAGPGNYGYIDEEGDDFYENAPDEDVAGEYDHWTLEKKLELFKKIAADGPEDHEGFFELMFSILIEFVDYDLEEKITEQLSASLDNLEIVAAPSDEMLGIKPGMESQRKEIEQTFTEIYELTLTDLKAAEKALKKTRGLLPENPAFCFLKLIILREKDNDEKYEKFLRECHRQHPDYPLLNLLWTISMYQEDETDVEKLFLAGPEAYFGSTTKIHQIELYQYLMMLTMVAVSELNISLVEVVSEIVDETVIDPRGNQTIHALLMMARLKFILSLADEGTDEDE